MRRSKEATAAEVAFLWADDRHKKEEDCSKTLPGKEPPQSMSLRDKVLLSFVAIGDGEMAKSVLIYVNRNVEAPLPPKMSLFDLIKLNRDSLIRESQTRIYTG